MIFMKNMAYDYNENNCTIAREQLYNLMKKYKYMNDDIFLIGSGLRKIYHFGIPNIMSYVTPSIKIRKIYEEFRNNMKNIKYNYIHYRHEKDFEKLAIDKSGPYYIPKLKYLIETIPFKKNVTYNIATSNIENIIQNENIDKFIIYKKNINLNFDESAFLDFLISQDAEEVYGYNLSGFSKNINKIKNTNDYYDKINL